MSLAATEALIGTLEPEQIRGIQRGSVVADFESVDDLRVTMDGDSEPSHVMSLVGELQADQRVMVLFTRPHGAYVIDLLHPPAWRTLSDFGTGWANLNVPPYGDAAVRRVGDRVELRGMVKRASGTGSTVLHLPTGFWIPEDQGFASDSGGAYASLFVQNTGIVLYNGGGTPSSSLSLGVVFYSVTP